MSDSLWLAIELIYAAAFLVVCIRSRRIALMMIFASAPFQQSLSVGLPVQFSLAEINLGVAFVYLIMQKRRLRIGPLALTVFCFLVVSILSVRNWGESTAIITVIQMVLYLVCATVVFCSLGATSVDFFYSFYGLIAVCAFLAATSLATGSYYILGLHKNGLGGSLACGTLVALELWFTSKEPVRRRILLAALALTFCGLVFSLSRGAWLGALAGMAVITALRRQWAILAQGGVILLPLIAIAWGLVPQDKREYALDISPDAYNVKTRRQSFELAESYFVKDQLLGQGVGLRKEYDATNIVMLTLAETGIIGLIVFFSIYAAFVWMILRTRVHVPVGSTDFSVMVVGAALMAEKLGHGMVDQFWGRGELMMAFAGAGMATAIYLKYRREYVRPSVVRATRRGASEGPELQQQLLRDEQPDGHDGLAQPFP